MRISDWSSDVCSSDLGGFVGRDQSGARAHLYAEVAQRHPRFHRQRAHGGARIFDDMAGRPVDSDQGEQVKGQILGMRSEEHTSELQSLMRISYAVFCLKQKKETRSTTNEHTKI